MYRLMWVLLIATNALVLFNQPWLALLALTLCFTVRCCCND
jgi:hypothetical protein